MHYFANLIKDYPDIIPILFVTIGFGIIGFIDDYIKVVMKRSMGLKAWQNLRQILITAIFGYYLLNREIGGIRAIEMLILFRWEIFRCIISFYSILFIVVLGTVNGSNLQMVLMV